ncbi:MAG: LysR family transcriptional regulator [Burkholderiaceae bacterium]|nr:LysR family transcriptional regulator [Burkholderiaceae bacterium]
MNKIDHFDPLDLNGHLLRLLLEVYETQSVTQAALRLQSTQSAVSHGLDRLRAITGDALFVRAGRGIVPTAQAHQLAVQARQLLDALHDFSHATPFEPARLSQTFTLAANDFQRDLLLPALLRRLHAQAPGVSLRVINSNAPQPALLRETDCDLVITPRPPDASDILQQRLFGDRYRVFYDAAQRREPGGMDDYLGAEHVTVQYDPGLGLDIDHWLRDRGIERCFVARVPGMGALGAMLRGGPWLATVPSLLMTGALRGLASAPVPLATPPLSMYMVWHRRFQDDPAHHWLRAHLLACVPAELRQGSAD